MAICRKDLDVETQRLHLFHQNLEALRDSWLLDVLALDDRLIDLHAAKDVVGLDGQELLQSVGGAVGLESPHLHLTEALSTELSLTTERLLGDHRVRACRASVNLVVDQVVQLQDVHVSHGDGHRVGLTGATIEQARFTGGVHETLAITGHQGVIEQTRDFFFAGAIEYRCRDLGAGHRFLGHTGEALGPGRVTRNFPSLLGSPSEVNLQHLTEVHTSGNTQRVQNDVDRGSILQERHVLDGQNLGDNTLVSVATSELVTLGDLALLGDVNHDALVDSRAKLVITIDSVKHLDANDGSLLTVGDLQRCVADLARLLVEDGTEQTLLGAELGFTLRRDFSDEDVAGANLGTDADDASLVQVGQQFRADVRKITSDLFLTELGVTGVHLVLLDVNRGEGVVLHQVLGQDDRVFEVVTLP